MAILEMFTWWYVSGWGVFLQKIRIFLGNVIDFFSMSDLLRTLFQPFRQISAASASAESSLDLKFHMFIDRLISRLVGFFSRLVLIFAGVLIICIVGILSFVLVVLWPLVPLTPLAGLILAFTGVVL